MFRLKDTVYINTSGNAATATKATGDKNGDDITTTYYKASNPSGYTSNLGTITGIKMNGASKGTSGVVDLGTVITAHQDISGKQDKLVSGTNIKTINNQSILGSGNMEMPIPTAISQLTNDVGFITSDYHDNTKISYGSIIQSLNAHNPSGQKIYIDKLDDTFYRANKRFTVTSSGFSLGSVNDLFDLTSDTRYCIDKGNIGTVNITGPTNLGMDYPYGYIYISFYYLNCPTSTSQLSAKVYQNWSGHNVGWVNLGTPEIVAQQAGGKIAVARWYTGNYCIQQLEVSVDNIEGTGAEGNNRIDIISLEFFCNRTGLGSLPMLTKRGGDTIYGTLTTTDTITAPNFNGLASKATGDKNGNDITTTYYKASNPNGYTSNVGTITGIKMNGSSKGTSGIVDLGTVITAHQDISGKQDKITETNKLDYALLKNTPDIPSEVTESTVAGWGFTKNTGTYIKPSTGIPKTDLASAIQTSLNKADTALQSYTETDPVFAASAASGIKSTDITNWNSKTSNVGTITGVSVNGTSVATSGVANITSLPASILNGAIKNGVTATTQSQGDNSTKVATTAYVDTAVANLPEPMVFKGTLGTDGTITTLPAAAASNEGWTYKVITAGTYQSIAAKVGDTFISTGSKWELIPSGDEPSGTVTSITLKATGPIAIDNASAITTSGTRTLSHANSGVTAGTYRSVTVNATGHITTGTNPTTLSGYGITDAKIENGIITLGSNTITPLTAHQDISGKVNKSGDTMTGALNFANNTLNKIGDDVSIGDQNVGGCLVIKGQNAATGIQFNPYSGSTSQKMTINGSGEMTITGSVTVANTIKTTAGDVNLADGAIIHYNSTDKCIEFNFS